MDFFLEQHKILRKKSMKEGGNELRVPPAGVHIPPTPVPPADVHVSPLPADGAAHHVDTPPPLSAPPLDREHTAIVRNEPDSPEVVKDLTFMLVHSSSSNKVCHWPQWLHEMRSVYSRTRTHPKTTTKRTRTQKFSYQLRKISMTRTVPVRSVACIST